MKKAIILLLIINSVLLSQKLKVTDYSVSSEGFITSWLIRGTFTVDDTRTRDFDFLNNPSEGKIINMDRLLKENSISGKGEAVAKWFPVSAESHTISFLNYFNKPDHSVCYALTFIESGKSVPVIFKCGSDDGIKLILNGKTIHNNNTWRSITPDEDNVSGELKKGMNCILVKVNNGTGDFGFCLKMLSGDGKPLENVIIKLPNNFSDEEIFKSIYSSFNVYTTYDKTDGSAKFSIRIVAESGIPVNLKGGFTLKLLLAEYSGKTIEEIYQEKIEDFRNFRSKEVTCKPKDLPAGRYSIKLEVIDTTGKILTEKENIVFWN